MNKVRDLFRTYTYIETSVKNKRKDLEAHLKKIEEESRILAIETSAKKRVALTQVLKTIGEAAVNEQVREFALRSISFTSIDSTENEILRLIECDLDKLTVGDKIRCNQRFCISIFDGYRNEIFISCDKKGIITKIKLSTISKYDK